MFNESQLLAQLTQRFSNAGYIFQIVRQESIVEIYLNFPQDASPNSGEIVREVQETIALLDWGDVEEVYLLGRSLGDTEPEWDVALTINTSRTTPETDSVDEGTDANEEETSLPNTEQRLSHYCFTRNKSLVTTEILPPSDSVAQLIQQFDALGESTQYQLVPQLDEFFRGKGTITTDEESALVWIDAYSSLSQNERRKATIWLSRYCANPATTLENVQTVLDPESVCLETSNPADTTNGPDESPINPNHSTDLMTGPQQGERDRQAKGGHASIGRLPNRGGPSDDLQQSLSPVPSPQTKLWRRLVPVVWIVFTLIFLIHDVKAVHNPEVFSTLCKGSQASNDICQLSGQLVGADTFATLIEEGKSLGNVIDDDDDLGTITSEEKAEFALQSFEEQSLNGLRACALEANFNANYTLLEPFEGDNFEADSFEGTQTEGVFRNLDQVMPGVFLMRITFPEKETQQPVTTACTLSGNHESSSLEGSDAIPENWPEVAYERDGEELMVLQAAFGLSLFSVLGINTFVNAVGIFCASMLPLPIQINSFKTLYSSAFLLSVLDHFLPFTQSFGIFRIFTRVALMSLSLGIISAFVKGLEIDWSVGYRMVGLGAITIMLTRTTIFWLLLYGLVSIFG